VLSRCARILSDDDADVSFPPELPVLITNKAVFMCRSAITWLLAICCSSRTLSGPLELGDDDCGDDDDDMLHGSV